MTLRKLTTAALALLFSVQFALAAAVRHTPTQTNGEPDDGVTYENRVTAEIGALWGEAPEYLNNVGGTANAITANSDTTVVSAVLALGRPKSFWLVPISNNTGPTTLTIDGLGPFNVTDKDNLALPSDALVAGRLTLLAFDGSEFRLAFSNGGTGTPASDSSVDNGRLSPATGVCIPPAAGVTAAIAIYWTLCGKGNQIALYDGISTWVNVASPERSIALTTTQSGTTSNGARTITGLSDTSQFIAGMKVSCTGCGSGAVISTIDSASQVTVSVNSTASATVTVTFKVPASTVLDVFGYLSSGSLKLEFAAWTNSTTRAMALTLQDGIYVKTGATTRRYLGTVETTATDGQTEFSYGSSASGGGMSNLLIWNAYNRISVHAQVRDSATGPYNYGGGFRAVDGSSTFRVNFVLGLAIDGVAASYKDAVTESNTVAAIAVALDVTNATSGSPGFAVPGISALPATYSGLPVAGAHFVQAIEGGDGVTGSSFHATAEANQAALAADLMM